jgi:hypothetical protein
MRKILKLSSDDSDSGSNKCKQPMVVSLVGYGGVCVWGEGGVWSQAIALMMEAASTSETSFNFN